MTEDKDLTSREHDSSGFGELPEDLRLTGPDSILDAPPAFAFEGDSYSLKGGAVRPFLNSIPPIISTAETFRAISYLSRANFPSFRSQRFFGRGSAILDPSGGTVFTSLFTITIPGAFSGVITQFGQWIGVAAAYNKPDGSADDISWRIAANSTAVFDYDNFPFMISSLDDPAEMFVIVNENVTIEVLATNNQLVGSPGAMSIPVKAVLFGHQFPIDELDDVFRNR